MSEIGHAPRAALGVLAVMGSGETSPTMVAQHRRLMEAAGGEAVLLDTPYGFQENASDISARALDYFAASVGWPMEVASFRTSDEIGSVSHERVLDRLRSASYLFAGPGSPSYALRQWSESRVPEILSGRLGAGATLCFASAAALTLARWTVPVYEIYKAGEAVRWLDGLDLLTRSGLPELAVIPHFDNSEGGTHDTRYCYLGERRLRILEEQLGDEAAVLGVDEHTICVIDLGSGTISAQGRGAVTLRRAGQVVAQLRDGDPSQPTLAFLSNFGSGGAREGPLETEVEVGEAARPSTAVGTAGSPLLERAVALEALFARSLAAGDSSAAAAAIIELEAELVAWSSDTLQSDEVDRARATLRSMVVRLGDALGAAHAARDAHGERVSRLVDVLVDARTSARREERFAESDDLRDGLAAAGVEVRDTPEGHEVHLGDVPEREA